MIINQETKLETIACYVDGCRPTANFTNIAFLTALIILMGVLHETQQAD
jgi:hypothetical protein